MDAQRLTETLAACAVLLTLVVLGATALRHLALTTDLTEFASR